MNFCTYSPDDVQVLIGGFYNVRGLADGTFIEVVKDTMPLTSQRSTDGMVSRRRVTNSTYTINISVLAASPANNLFTRLWRVDELTNLGKFPLLIKDSSGTGYFFSPTTWIEQLPSMKYGTTGETNTWVLRAHNGIFNVGGNDPQTDIQILADLALSSLPYIQQIINKVG
jgi:hypothetical protein